MRYLWAALTVAALTNSATADECNIIWWDLFLPPAKVEFEKASEVSGLLTLKETTKLEPIRFELATSTLTGEDGARLDVLLSERTLVDGSLSNQVTVTLQPKTNSWVIGFDSKQTIRTKDGRVFHGQTNVSGFLVCNHLKPWP